MDCFNLTIEAKGLSQIWQKIIFNQNEWVLATPPSSFVLPFQIVSHKILLLEIAALSLTHFSEQLVQPMHWLIIIDLTSLLPFCCFWATKLFCYNSISKPKCFLYHLFSLIFLVGLTFIWGFAQGFFESVVSNYRNRTIVNHGLYIFYPISLFSRRFFQKILNVYG